MRAAVARARLVRGTRTVAYGTVRNGVARLSTRRTLRGDYRLVVVAGKGKRAVTSVIEVRVA